MIPAYAPLELAFEGPATPIPADVTPLVAVFRHPSGEEHRVAGFGAVVNHGPYRSIFLNSDGHIGYPPHDDRWIAAPRHG